MSKLVQFEGATHEFPDDFTDADIATALKSAHPLQPPAKQQDPGFLSGLYENTWEPLVQLGAAMAKNPIRALYEAGKGLLGESGKYVAKTGESIGKGDIMGAVRNAPGMVPGIGPAVENITDRTEQGQYGRAAGNLAGLVLPMVAPEMAGATAGAAQRVAGTVTQPLAEHMYQSALKPRGIPKQTAGLTKQVVRTGLREEIPVSESGLGKLQTTKDTVNQQIADSIAGSDQTIQPGAVAGRVDQLRDQFRTVNPEDSQAALTAAKQEFIRQHSTEAPYTKVEFRASDEAPEGQFVPVGKGSTTVEEPISVQDAQRIKQNTYRELKQAAFGQQKPAAIEAQKALARGLKEEIAAAVPEIAGLNARDSELIALNNVLDRAAIRIGNRDILPIGDWKISAIKKLIDAPQIKSRIAIAVNKATARSGTKVPPVTPEQVGTRLRVYMNARLAAPEQDQPNANQP